MRLSPPPALLRPLLRHTACRVSSLRQALPTGQRSISLRKWLTGMAKGSESRDEGKGKQGLGDMKSLSAALPSSPSSTTPTTAGFQRSSPLSAKDGPLVWVDLELTGLEIDKDRIIEIAVIITDGELNPVDDGIEYVVKTPKEVLDAMGPWSTNQHALSGLTSACLSSPHAPRDVARAVLDYVRKWVPKRGDGVIAGSSVHVDKRFMERDVCGDGWREVAEWCHYRVVDVSTIKEVAKRWLPDLPPRPRQTESNHRALDDIRSSIEELKYYRRMLFKSPEEVAKEAERVKQEVYGEEEGEDKDEGAEKSA